jgi:glycosyltransferase involved in cell wall biosynthesis
MNTEQPVVILVDNSISFTGAFKCALQQAILMKPFYRYVFILPEETNLVPLVKENGFTVFTLPMLEIKKNGVALARYWPRLFRNSSRLKKIVRNEAASIIVMNDFYNLLGVTIKMRGVKIRLVTYIRLLPNAIPGMLRKLWIGAAIKYADKIIVVSDAVKCQLIQNDKIVRVYDPIAFNELYPLKEIKKQNSEVRLVYIGNYIRGKGHNHAVQAFKLAFPVNKKLRLDLVGGDMGLEKNRKFRDELESEVLQSGLTEFVRFMPFERDIERLMKSADIFLNFSEAESFSMTCAEASYYGVPSIASKCGGPEEIILDGETGILVENRNVTSMKEQIIKLAADTELQNKFSREAPLYVKEKFNTQNFINSIREVFN